MDLAIRTITDDEVPAWCAALNTGFLNTSGDIDAEARRPGLFLDRTWAGLDGDRIVATLRSFPTRMTVPGGAALDASAVTAVSTTSTHRRRGVASRMVAAELAASADRGEPVSILIAAEWGIYGRFGYGAATEHQTLIVDALAGRLRERPQGTVDYVDRDTARAIAPRIYDQHLHSRPGEIARPDRYWDIDFGIVRVPSRPEPKPAFHAVARDRTGAPVGLVRYTYTDRWEHRLPRGEVTVSLFLAVHPVAERLLWHHLLGLDWVATIQVEDRPADEILPWLLTDSRHVRMVDRADLLWLRPLDVGAMLAARTYPVPGTLVIEVVDPDGPAGGRFRLDAVPDGATCARTDATADLTLGAGVLGSVYLGGFPMRTLAAAGLVAEHAPGVVERADTMFRSAVGPWCSTWF
jgi:predicted acetyltransferase